MIDIDAVADQTLPADSSDAQQVADASNLLAELVRRLCRATRHGEAVPTPIDADRTLSSLAIAVDGLPQLCTQLADRMHAIGKLPGLAADNLGTISDPAVIAEAAAFCLGVAVSRLGDAGRSLRTVTKHTSRLYIDDAAPDIEEPPLPPQPRLQGP